MLPFSIDKLLLDLKHDMDVIKTDFVKHKYQFCVLFEKELFLEVGDYAQTVFDYAFNLFFFKRAFTREDFKMYLEEFKDLNFMNSNVVCSYISAQYMKFIIIYKKYFMDYFGYNHEDNLYIARKIEADRKGTIQKILEYY